jgi:carbon storage regulator
LCILCRAGIISVAGVRARPSEGATRGSLAAGNKEGRLWTIAGQEDGTVLVLTRKGKQQIVLGDRIVVTVVRIQGKTVQLGIEAPEEVPVHREEIHDARKKREMAPGMST